MNEITGEFNKDLEKIKLSASERILKNYKCVSCGSHLPEIVTGYFINPIQENLSNFNLGGSSIPSIAIVCRHCGFIQQHALGALKLLPTKKN